eukprot:scaffold8340_cov91-Skeletonema_dohrnii-CCMP3373.AAC.1
MEHSHFNYYEANAADISLGDITSTAENAKILQRLRDDDDNLHHLWLGTEGWNNFCIGEGDDWGWLGYFIGRSACLQRLFIRYLPDGEEGHAFVEGIARSQSIQYIGIHDLNNDAFTSIMRALHSFSQLEGLSIDESNSVGPDGWYELRFLLESGGCKLKQLCLRGNNYIGNAGMGILSNELRGIGSFLELLILTNSSIGNEELLALVTGLTNCTSLETLRLSRNNFSSAEAGLGSLSNWLQRDIVNVKYLGLSCCSINDEGLHALSQGAANHCEELDLIGNESITATGLSYLSDSIRSHSCCVETLHLQGIPVGDNEMEVLARGLADNKSVRNLGLNLDDLHDDISVHSSGWIAFSTALCDTSSVNSTYLSNHTICDIWDEEDGEAIPHQDIALYLRLNEQHPQYAARCKILMSHPHLDMAPLLHWGLKLLPLAVAWFERSKPCTTLTIYDEDSDLRQLVLDESDEAFESRELTALYEFVRGIPLEVMKSRHGLAVAAAYDEKIARIEEENKIALEQRDRKIEERDRRIEQLEEEIMRLRGW